MRTIVIRFCNRGFEHGRFWFVVFVEVRARRFLGNEARFFNRYIKRDSYIFTILTTLLFAHDRSTIYSILFPEPTMIWRGDVLDFHSQSTGLVVDNSIIINSSISHRSWKERNSNKNCVLLIENTSIKVFQLWGKIRYFKIWRLWPHPQHENHLKICTQNDTNSKNDRNR